LGKALIANSRLVNSNHDKFLHCQTVLAHLPINVDNSMALDNLFWGSCSWLSTINERNFTVHFQNANALKKSVSIAAGLLERHLTLSLEYPSHNFVSNHFSCFEQTYPRIFELGVKHLDQTKEL
jgi:hypothetical protein